MEKGTGFMAEFKQFISRGNVMDMAVGVIVGGAFKAIADSLTADILMPLILLLTQGGADLSALAWTVGGSVIGVGNFLQAILNFLIMAFAVFCLVRGINRFHRKKEVAPAAPPAPPAPSQEELLLTEIRDLLKAQNGKA
ncbi:MAG: large conductance mechanosensitive channel protein MscL [Oscillibacter sp.]